MGGLLGPVQTGLLHEKAALSPKKKTRLDLVSCCRHHQPSSRDPGARGSPHPPWPFVEHRARSELNKGCDPGPSRIGAEVCSPSTVSLCRMQLLEARFVLFRDSPFVGPTLHLGYGWVDRASTIKGHTGVQIIAAFGQGPRGTHHGHSYRSQPGRYGNPNRNPA